MAPQSNNWQGTFGAADTSITLASYTVGAGANKIIVVGVGARDLNGAVGATQPTSVTWGGTPLTKIKGVSCPQETNHESGVSLWGLVNPPAQAADIVVTWSESQEARLVYATYLTDAEQVLPTTLTIDVGSTTNVGSWIITINSVPDDALVIDACAPYGPSNRTYSVTQTDQVERSEQRAGDGVAFLLGSERPVAVGANIGMGWQASLLTSSRRACVAAAFRAYVPPSHDLTADDLDLGAATLGQTALGQTHALTSSAFALPAVLLDQPEINVGGIDDLVASDLTLHVLNIVTNSGEPVTNDGEPVTLGAWGAAVLGQVYDLTAADLALTAPALAEPAVGQVHALAATALTGAAVSLSEPTLAQVHVLAADGIALAPVLDQATLDQIHALAADGLDTATELGEPALTQQHALAAAVLDLAVQLAEPQVGQAHVLGSSALTLAAPALEEADIGQVHVLAANALAIAAVTLGQPPLSTEGTDALAADGLALAAFALGQPTVGQIHALAASDLSLAAVTLAEPVVEQQHALAASDLAVTAAELDQPAVGQEHVLLASDLDVAAVALGEAALSHVHVLVADSLDLPAAALGVPGQVIVDLTADDLSLTTPVLASPVLVHNHVLAADDLDLTPVALASPAAGHVHVLGGNVLVLSAVALGRPGLNRMATVGAAAIINRSRATVGIEDRGPRAA